MVTSNTRTSRIHELLVRYRGGRDGDCRAGQGEVQRSEHGHPAAAIDVAAACGSRDAPEAVIGAGQRHDEELLLLRISVGGGQPTPDGNYCLVDGSAESRDDGEATDEPL